MTYYQQQISSIKNFIFPKEYLCDQVIQAKKFIDGNFSGTIDLRKIANEAHYSRFHFLRLFKLLYGKTPHQYLTEVRIEKAKQLLKAGSAVPDVCFSVGFDSVSSFKGLFKRYTGFTPASFQLQGKNRERMSEAVYRFLPFFLTYKKAIFKTEEKIA